MSTALNTDSISDMKRIINVPSRGIGKITLLKIVEGREDELSLKIAQKVDDFKLLLKKIAHTGDECKAERNYKIYTKRIWY